MPVPPRPSPRTAMLAAVVAALAVAAAPPARAAPPVTPFPVLQAPLTQQLYSTFTVPAGAYAGGMAFAPDGTLLVGVCHGPAQLHRVGGTPVELHGSAVVPDHPVDLDATIGCGLVNGPDGVYANASTGVVKVDPVTGAVLARSSGPAGNGLGIAYDPQGGRFLYAGPTGLDWVSSDLSRSGVFSTRSEYDGVYLDPSGDYVFAADGEAVDVYDRSGTLTQRVDHTDGPGGPTDGVAFHATDGYVVTNNTDGTITRLDFPGHDLTKAPAQTLLASGGFRGDLLQVGADSCLYVTQDGARYADGTATTEQSIVKICGGFVAPPATVAPQDVALGDGFSSGEGAGNYLPASDSVLPHNSCHRSAAAYPWGLATARQLGTPQIAACSHARISDLFTPNSSGQLTGAGVPEPAQLDSLGPATQLVTLTIGAEDLGLTGLLTQCLRADLPRLTGLGDLPRFTGLGRDQRQPSKGGHDPAGGGRDGNDRHDGAQGCSRDAALAAQVDHTLAALAGSGPTDPATTAYSVPQLLAEITRRAPGARIQLAGYPMPFGTSCPAHGCQAGRLTLSGAADSEVPAMIDGVDAQWIDRAIDRLNGVLRAAASTTPAASYTDVTTAFAGHGLCDRRQPWLNPVSGTVSPDGVVRTLEPQSLHPTAVGQAQGYLTALSG